MVNNNKNNLHLNDPVIINKGRFADLTGRICRKCIYTTMVWVYLDKYKNHDYESVAFGPFFPCELSFNAELQQENQQCLFPNIVNS